MRNYISVLALEGGLGQGSITEGVVLNRKCRTMEYSLSARLFTVVGFDELVGTHLSIFCLLLFFFGFIKSP